MPPVGSLPTASSTPSTSLAPQTSVDLIEKLLSQEDFKYLWTMYYRHGMQSTLSKNFYFKGTLVEARKRAENHCKIMGYKFYFLRPMIAPLDNEEAYQIGENQNASSF